MQELFELKTELMECSGLRFVAKNAMLTWDMFFQMALPNMGENGIA
jgi:hypothetical protein